MSHYVVTSRYTPNVIVSPLYFVPFSSHAVRTLFANAFTGDCERRNESILQSLADIALKLALL